MNYSKKLFFFIFLFSPSLFAEEEKWWTKFQSPLDIQQERDVILEKYTSLHKKFFQTICRPGLEPQFWNLNKNYRSHGNYVPILTNGKLDEDTINKFLPELLEKEKWILAQKEIILSYKTFNPFLKKIEFFRQETKRLLKYKERFYEETSNTKKQLIKNESKYQLLVFKDLVKKFFQELTFLQSYRFPVDHLSLRNRYDQYKNSKDPKEKKVANEIYFYRKIVQDGARNLNHTLYDRGLRAAIDTSFLEMDDEHDFLEENLRSDLEWELDGIERFLNIGIKRMAERFDEWFERSSGNRKYYQSLSFGEGRVRQEFDKEILELLSKKEESRNVLRDFVLKNNAKSYDFWMKQSPLMRMLFAIETILFNEVGRVDAPWGVERKEVAQIVLNRSLISEYSQFKSHDALLDVLQNDYKYNLETLNKYPWLNVLFKEGEFSFTYFFISGNVKTYCPDMSRLGKSLRRENLKIAIQTLKEPDFSQKALRYFSRAAMLGRIDMAKLWTGFTPVKERPGPYIEKSSELYSLYQKGNYEYVYHFFGADERLYKVVSIKDRKHVLLYGEEKFFIFRSPHLFRYFK